MQDLVVVITALLELSHILDPKYAVHARQDRTVAAGSRHVSHALRVSISLLLGSRIVWLVHRIKLLHQIQPNAKLSIVK